MTEQEILEEIEKLELEIGSNEYWLEYGGMSNPMKIQRRKRDIRDCKNKIAELKSKLNLK